ncbi:nudix hydrolase 8 [Drosophila innubila]|uniref:nudix hydrolase 8 n=1 Tax=Drosophila innubila TaxID=198719 RepID=UPI00148D6461|nr:nudix hydrolase 8 [Drosophila innubila]
MSPAVLLSRSNCFMLNAFNTWRKLNIVAATTTTRNYNTISNKNNNKRFFGKQRENPVKTTYRHYQTYKSMDSPPDVFRGVTDRFKGVTVDGKQETTINHTEFRQKLQKSLDYWTAQKKRAIWFRVYKEQADWVPILAESGFDFHHARTGVVVMYRWLPTDETPNLPHYAHTLLGVGGLVINDQNEVLVVSDRNAPVNNIWKLPGGYVEPNENLIDAAVREVKEETGIRTTFTSMICLRHSHAGNFGCSDIYIVMGLKPQNLDINRCNREIERVRWMPLDEYLEHPQVLEGNRLFARTYLDNRKRGLDFTCTNMLHQVLKKEYQLYYVDTQPKN